MPSSPTEILLPNRPSDAPRPAAVTDGEHHSLLVALLAVAVCAVLAGACTFAAITDWVRDLDRPAWGRLGFTDRVPAATTVWRLLIRIDADVLSAVLGRWLRERATPVVVAGRRWRLVIAIDGKVERGARLPDGRQVHLLSADDTAAGVVLAQMQIAAKSNEIPAFAPLLDRVATQLGSLDKVLVVADTTPRADRPRRAGRCPGRAPDGPGQRQPADPMLPAQGAALGAGAGRRPPPRGRSRAQGDPHGQGGHRGHPGRAGLPARRAGSPDHPDPHDQGQDHPGGGVHGRVTARRARPARRSRHMGAV